MTFHEQNYQARKDAGVCAQCANPNLVPGCFRCQKCIDKHKKHEKKARLKRASSGLCRKCGKREPRPNRATCESCGLQESQKVTRQHALARLKILEHYGNKCTCCGETNSKYLQIDHINNDGNVQRKAEPNVRGSRLLKRYIKNGYPTDLQVLCANCHFAKSFYGGCTEEDHE
jgi:ribosomal protein L37E